ncbi:MAG: DUF4340 domain-containing protein [Kiritimatiellae bacterium]|nr:DUF4340 domain-containing protein [Kiritimatiellia bacterium]
MNAKTLIVLVAAAVLLGGMAYYSVQKKKPSSASVAIGGKALQNLDVNRVAKLVIISGTGRITVARPKGRWVVASRFNYPANFDKVADVIRELSELKIGQIVNAPPGRLADFNLVSPAPAAATNQPAGSGTLVELRDENDGLMASLIIGKNFMRPQSAPMTDMAMNFGDYSAGRYVQSVDNKVYLVAKSLDRLTEEAKTWLADDFIMASAADIMEINVSGPDRDPIKLVRAREGGDFSLADLRPGEGSLDSSKISRITGALDHLGFDDVADPALTPKETGLDRPLVFKAATKDGLIYTLQAGNQLADDNQDRYFTISATNDPALAETAAAGTEDEPAAGKKEKDGRTAPSAQEGEKKSAAERAAELNAKFGSWIYIVKSYRAEPMLITRADLIKKPEPEKKEAKTEKNREKEENKKSE